MGMYKMLSEVDMKGYEVKLEKIHQASMKILDEIGIKLHSEEIIKLLKENGIRVSGDIAYFTEEQVMEYVKMAPSEFTIHAKNSKYDMIIGGDNTEYCTGYGCASIIDKDGYTRPALLEDYINFIKIIEQSDTFNINGGIAVQPNDVDQGLCELIMIYTALNYSEKCILGIPGEEEHINHIIDLMKIFYGEDEFCKKHRMLTLISITSPLQIDKISLDSMTACIENNQPIVITPGPIAGGTSPITLAGTLALGNAEALSGIIISQIIKPGTPVVYGLLPQISDVRTGNVSIGSPAFALGSAYSSRMGKYYGLPCRNGGTQTDAKGVSVQSGYEAMMNMMNCRHNDPNFILHSAGILDGFGAMSYEQFIIDLEIISMVDYYFRDITVNEDDLAFDIIKEVGHGGQFLSSPHTFERCRTVPWYPKIGISGIVTDERNCREIIDENIDKRLSNILEDYKKPDMNQEVHKKLYDYLIEKGVEEEVLKSI